MNNLKYLLILLLFVPQIMSAYYFKHLGVKDGLSQLSVMSIHQDKLGRMWFGTREGISLYDGEKITVYKPGGLNANEKNRTLGGNEVGRIVSDVNGDLFMIVDASLVKYDIRKERFDEISSRKPHAICSFKGQIWCVIKDSIFRYDSRLRKLTFSLKTGLPAIRCLLCTDNGIWIGDNHGLYLYRGNKLKCIIPKIEIFRLFESSTHEIWVGTRMNGLFRIGPTGKVFEVPYNPLLDTCIASKQIRDIIEDNRGNIWFGTFDGLQMYNPKTDRYTIYRQELKFGSLGHSSIFSLYEDIQGTIWIGTYYGGVNYFNPGKDIFTYYPSDPRRDDCLSFPIVGPMVEDKDGNIWIGTDGGGIDVLNRKSSRFTYYIAKGKNSLSHNNVKSICYDKKRDCVYIGTHIGGLSRLDRKSGRFYNYLEDFKRTGTGPNDVIFEVMFVHDMLVVTARNGLFIMNPDTGVFKQIIPDIYYLTFDVDTYGNVWLAGYNDILCVNLKHPEKRKSLLLKDYGIKHNVIKIMASSDGLIYIGTLGSGMYSYDPQKNKMIHYSAEEDNLLSNYCYNIAETAQKNILVTSDKGFSLLNTSTRSIRSVQQGGNCLIPPIIDGSGVLVTNSNQIYIGGSDGLVSFREKDLDVVDNASNLYFSDLYVNNAKIYANDETGILKESISFTKNLDLSSFQNDLIIGFSASNYVDILKNTSYEYKFEGFDEKWISTDQRNIYYTNLNPGKYILKIREIGNSLKTRKQHEISLLITIHHPWYNTYWAWIFYIFAVALICYWIRRVYNSKRTLKISLENERIEKERIEELNQSKLHFFTNVSHEFRTPLTLIISQIELLLQNNQIAPSVYNSILKIRKNAQQMRALISELLDFRKFEQKHVVLKVAKQDMVFFLREVYFSFFEYASQRSIDYHFKCDQTEILCWFDRWQMKKVIFNLLSNAFKYTADGGEINLWVYETSEAVIVEVKDNGIGIKPSALERIFDCFYQAEHIGASISNPGTGIGLALTKSIVSLHHGKIRVESNPGEGSRFIFTLPKGNTHFESDNEVVFLEQTEEPTLQDNTLPDNAFIAETSNMPEDFAAQSKAARHKLLIVDDNVELLHVLENIFSPLYDVTLACNGAEGMKKILSDTPDLVISDVMMPVMTGTEMCLQIKTNIDLCHIPVILLTALDTPDQNIEGLRRGADDYITKPFNAKVLLARCNNLIRNRILMQSKFAKETDSDVNLLAANPLDKSFLDNVVKIIDKHIGDTEFDIAVLCRESGVGRTLLHTKFKALTGMTPNDFILNHKLKQAAIMLKNDSYLQIAEIADNLGFGSARYFSRCFKNQYNLTPVEYRKGNLKE